MHSGILRNNFACKNKAWHPLSAATLPDQSNSGTSGHIKGKVLEDLELWSRRVVEVHPPELYVTPHALELFTLFLVINLRLPVHRAMTA